MKSLAAISKRKGGSLNEVFSPVSNKEKSFTSSPLKVQSRIIAFPCSRKAFREESM